MKDYDALYRAMLQDNIITEGKKESKVKYLLLGMITGLVVSLLLVKFITL